MAEANKLLFFVGVIAAILVVSSLAIAQKASLSPTEVAKQTFAAVEKKDTEAFKALMCKYLREARLPAGRSEAFGAVVEVFDRTWYGRQPIDPDRVREFEEAARRAGGER